MWIDIVWLILALFGLWKGWTQGLILSIFITLAWIIGLLGALKLSSVMSHTLQEIFNIQADYLPVLSFIVVFILIALLIYLVGKSLEKIIEMAHLGIINKISGAILRIGIYTLLFGIFLRMIDQIGFIKPELKASSKTYGTITDVTAYIINHASGLMPVIKKLFEGFHNFFEKVPAQK
ncbi:MAG: CvpA family protein [Chitinophagales bacterium]|nr:CvpA family protein [Chitinophagales bacterium]